MADTGKTFSCSAQIGRTPLVNAKECRQPLHCHAAVGTVAVSRIIGRLIKSKLAAPKAPQER
jgi:hypothetical protein